jgi:histidine phosphotransferase ChpT
MTYPYLPPYNDAMPQSPHDLAALLGSRICHDLINPLGAIGNGVELLRMTQASSPELDLIADSVAHAQARIRMFRLAFGAVREEQRISGREIGSILEGLSKGGKLRFAWSLPVEVSRQEAKLLLLLVQCCENAMPWGGVLSIGHEGAQWQLSGQASRLRVEPELWDGLSRGEPPASPSPAQVHFSLIPQMLAETGRRLSMQSDEETLKLSF